MATKAQLKASIAANIKGQGNQLDLSNKLGDILDDMLDLVPFTLESSKSSFSDASDLTKSAAATALGITGDELDDLMRGKYLRYSYNSGAVVLGVDSANGTDLMLGAAQVIVQLGASGYTIILSE